ncbi:tripartite tricarboxylate transporter TctB family protein [soil metagenome]
MTHPDGGDPPTHTRDVLAELESEVAHELEEERPPAGGPGYQIVVGLIGLGLGTGAAILSSVYGLGSLREPGPGTWPFIVAILIAALSALLLVVGRNLQDTEKFSHTSLLPATGAVTFIAFGLLMPVTGFELPALALCVIWLRFLGRESWRNTIVISLGTVTVFYLLFLYGLRIPLPHLLAF